MRLATALHFNCIRAGTRYILVEGDSIALRIPVLAAIAGRKDCSLTASRALTPEEAQIAIGCDGHYLEEPRVSVNLRNGMVSDLNNGKQIDAPEATQLAAALLSSARRMRLSLPEDVHARCAGVGY